MARVTFALVVIPPLYCSLLKSLKEFDDREARTFQAKLLKVQLPSLEGMREACDLRLE